MLKKLFTATMPQFIKGFEISRDKVAATFNHFKIDVAIDVVIQQFLDRDGFKYIACGHRVGHDIVLDDDYDE